MFYIYPIPDMDKQTGLDNSSTFAGKNQCRLYKKYWKPEGTDPPRAIVFVAHGFGEHCEWYGAIAQHLIEKGILVAAHDHVGHGRSEGQRAQIYDFEQYIDDMLIHVDLFVKEHPGVKVFLLGHSMGGCVALRTVLRRPNFFSGLVTIGPLIIPSPDALSPWKITLGKMVASVLPSLPVERLDSSMICRDAKVVKKYKEDPLVYHGGVRAKWGMCVLAALQNLQGRLEEVTVPLLTIQGDSDKLCEKSGAEKLQRLASSTDKKLSLYAGAYHQVHNEPDGVGEKAMTEITNWIIDHA